ncbi:uncharacterized protein L201_002998 [Kwoniella dendrophila CBS 6074]|uniref:Cation efflux protein transmembrane domain-containing protein n=1 Tax=Kwoniella dendrophila CBS 6074 TaxID=1295534 RepID=A0AAX4JS52_9TREE
MQAPSTPTPLHRTVHKVPSRKSLFLGQQQNSSSFYTSTSKSNYGSNTRSNSYLRLFIGALAITASKTSVLDDPRHLGGGIGWLVLGLWSSRIIGQLGQFIGDSRRKSKDGKISANNSIQLSIALAIQSVAFFTSLQHIGPLRLIIIAYMSSMVGSVSLTDINSLAPILPILFSSIYIIGQAATQNVTSLVGTIVFAATTFLADQYLSDISQIKTRYEDKDKSNNDKGLWHCLISTAVSSMIVFGLYQMNIIPIPLPISTIPGQRFASFITGLLVRYIPFPFASSTSTTTSSSAPGSVLQLKTNRDRILFICTIPVLQFFALHPIPTSIDLLVLLPLALFSTIMASGKKIGKKDRISPWGFTNKSLSTARSSWSFMSLLPAKWRPHLQTILNTPTSSKIFYFLLLNLAYMFVQMVYGVATNSLGLISDAIHMLFDCFGIAVGLWASVAATWKPDGRYTFGYSRVETLSGFANGCFLILISIFIIFEGIQRVLDPPEMETQQLLLVSAVGLGINLFGMWATGGHHHHGHSHGHDHGHGHSHAHSHGHSHIPVNEKKADHRHGHVHDHDHHRSESQGTSASTRPQRTLAKRRSSGYLRSHAQQDAHAHANAHNHDAHQHETCNGHGHDGHDHHHHDHEKSHTDSHTHHDHSHSHSHNHDDDHHHDHSLSHSHSHDDHGHGHDHAHSHNMRGVFLHVLADTLGSVGVIVSTILIKYTGWTGFDPIASLFIAVLIMASVIPLVIDSGKVLCLDVGSDKEEEIRNALSELKSIDGVANYASPRFWPRCEGELIGSIHIQLSISPSSFDPSKSYTPYLGGNNNQSHNQKQKDKDLIYVNSEKVLNRVDKLLKKKIRGLSELIIQIEGGAEEKGFCNCMTGR